MSAIYKSVLLKEGFDDKVHMEKDIDIHTCIAWSNIDNIHNAERRTGRSYCAYDEGTHQTRCGCAGEGSNALG